MVVVFRGFPLVYSLTTVVFARTLGCPVTVFSGSGGASLSVIAAAKKVPDSRSTTIDSLVATLVLRCNVNSNCMTVTAAFNIVIVFSSVKIHHRDNRRKVILVSTVGRLAHLSLGFPGGRRRLVTRRTRRGVCPRRVTMGGCLKRGPSRIFIKLLANVFIAFVIEVFCRRV